MTEEPDSPAKRPVSFIEVAMEMDLQGPPDWSENINEYLSAQKRGESD